MKKRVPAWVCILVAILVFTIGHAVGKWNEHQCAAERIQATENRLRRHYEDRAQEDWEAFVSGNPTAAGMQATIEQLTVLLREKSEECAYWKERAKP